MRWPSARAAALALALVAGSGCSPGQGGLKLVVSYDGPRDACVVLKVAPADEPARIEERQLGQLPRVATRAIGIVPRAGDGEQLELGLEVRQRGCAGVLIWKQQYSAAAARPAALLEARIVIRDQDDDTWADARGAFVEGQLPGTDCDDSRAAIHPGAAEQCNGFDDDCNEVRDDGLTENFFFLDADGDGWGNPSLDAGQTACAPPQGYAADGGDCDDGRALVHPARAELCNGLDDDCDGEGDEGFGVGEPCDAGYLCSGAIQCQDGGAAQCVSPAPLIGWFADEDGDGHGEQDGGAILACVQPPRRAPNSDDCDDANRFIHVGAREVCDGKDDDCDSSTIESCSDAGFGGFTRFPLPTTAANWKAVAPFARGFAWVVGDGNQIALRYFQLPSGTLPRDGGPDGGSDGGEDAGGGDGVGYDAGFGDGGFLNYSGRCVGNFRAAWAAPSGRLYLAETNKIARLDLDGGCVQGWFSVPQPSDVSGLSGVALADGGISLLATVLDGRTIRVAETGSAGTALRTWRPDAGPTTLLTVDALGRAETFVAGSTNPGGFYFAQLQPDGGGTARLLPAAGVASPLVNASGALSSSRAYFAGNNNTLFGWEDGSCRMISGPGPATSHFVGLAAFGRDHLLAVDSVSRVWRYDGKVLADGGTTAELWVDLSGAGTALRALAATAPDDVWVVGSSNAVLHFGQ